MEHNALAASKRYSFSLSRTAEITANVATTMVAVLLTVILTKVYLLHTTQPQSINVPVSAGAARGADPSLVGTSLTHSLSDIRWKANNLTLVLARSTHCHFCTESAPYFRNIRNKIGNRAKILAVLPEAVSESNKYLVKAGVRPDFIKQVHLESVGVAGTPTTMLVNSAGTVTQSWIGKLNDDTQAKIIDAVVSSGSSL